MNQLSRFRFGNLHKRRILVVISMILLMVFTSVLFLTFIGFFGSRAELVRVRATAELTAGRSDGVGINVLEIPDTNIIDDPFFGKNDNCISAQVSETQGYYIYFDPDEASSLSGVTAGNSVDILSIDGTGKMGLRYSGQVMGYTDTVFGVPVAIEDQSAMWLNDPVVKCMESSGSLYLITQSGKLISDAAVSPSVIESEDPFVDMCAEGISVYALTLHGNIYISTDAGQFTLLGTCTQQEGKESQYITVSNGNINILFTDGTIAAFAPTGPQTVGDIQTDKAVSGDGFMIVCSGNEVYVSRNGLFMELVDGVSDFMREGDQVVDLEANDNAAFILTSYGKLIKVDMSYDEPLVTSRDISSVEPVSICPSGSNAVIVAASDNQAYYVSLSSGNPRSLGMTGVSVDDVFQYGEDSYIVRSGNILYEVSLMSAVEVDLPIADDLVLEGDICMIKNSTADTHAWDLYGSTELVTQTSGVSLIGTGNGQHAMSRLLEEPSSALFEKNLFYRVEVTLSSSTPDASCYVWLEGDTFGNEGLHITDIGDQPRSYSYVFVVTENMLSDESLRFNISFEGDAVVNVYNVYVGLDRYDINSVPTEFTDNVIACAPSALRFPSIVPGSDDYCEETFYGVSAASLERAMILSKDSGANPWLVMGPYVTQNDVDAFLGYVCGSVSDEYGRRRIDNGTALPWSRQFETIYVEINDSDNVFPTDSQRGAYVSYVISLFAKSEFYIAIKDRIVFIDGMNYEGGVMLSDADRHATGIVLDAVENEGVELSFVDSVYASIDNAIYQAPRMGGNGTNSGEYVSSVRIGSSIVAGNYSAADIVSAIIRAESMYSDIIMIDSDMSSCGLISSLRPLIDGDLMYCEIMEPLDPSSRFSAEGFNEACETILIDKPDSIVMVVANHSDTLQQFVVLSDAYDTSDGFYRRYSSQGALLMERDLNRLGLRLVLQAGEYMVIEIPK
jgi:hypothetical protein